MISFVLYWQKLAVSSADAFSSENILDIYSVALIKLDKEKSKHNITRASFLNETPLLSSMFARISPTIFPPLFCRYHCGIIIRAEK